MSKVYFNEMETAVNLKTFLRLNYTSAIMNRLFFDQAERHVQDTTFFEWENEWRK